jgi:HNH endonuclease
MKTIHVSAELSDKALLAEVKRLAEHERVATADLIAILAELDARRLYLGEGCSSLFSYCTRVLHLSEHAAYGRIEAARAARRHPVILDMLAAGSVNLTTVCLLTPHLTEANHVAVLNAAHHKSKREVWARDAGQCAFVGTNGRCTERGFLEFHHVVPFAAGGPATTENIQLRCRAHNGYEEKLFFGPLLAREEEAIFGCSTRSRPG